MDTSVDSAPVRAEILVAGSSDQMFRQAAELFSSIATQSPEEAGQFTVALSGGNTPRRLYEILATEPFASRVPWDRTQVFFSDERFVPLGSPESNQRMATEALLSRVPIPERFIHRVPTADETPDEAAAIYEEGIRRTLLAGQAGVPRFDLILLGLGTDGHTASLFPQTDALAVTDRLVVANHVPQQDSWRITFTYPLIAAARTVMFLVEGESKARIVARVLGGDDFPAARVQPTDGRLVWLLDEAAAHQLPTELRAG